MAVGKSGEPRPTATGSRSRFGGMRAWPRTAGARPSYDEAPVAPHEGPARSDRASISGSGAGKATVWTCDLTHGYIDINADYRS